MSILTDKELCGAVIVGVISSNQAERDAAILKLQRHILSVEVERDAREAECERRYADQVALRARVAELEAALRMMYDKYENGDGCYEDPDVCSGYLGSAVKLSDEEEQQVYALLEKQP